MDKLRSAISAGKPSFGSWISTGDPMLTEVIGRAGYDWVILDTQHGAIDWHQLLTSFQALDLGGTRALVRVGWSDPAQIMRALDLGAMGVVVPMVSNAEQAAIAAKATRYPPGGYRSFGTVRNYYGAPGEGPPEPLCLVMIETAEAMDNLDAIAATPGVDGLFVGPMDLALALGHGATLVMPDVVLEAIDEVVSVCRRRGIVPGCASLGMPNARALMQRGVRFLTLGSEVGLIRRGAAADLAQVQAWLDEADQADQADQADS